MAPGEWCWTTGGRSVPGARRPRPGGRGIPRHHGADKLTRVGGRLRIRDLPCRPEGHCACPQVAAPVAQRRHGQAVLAGVLACRDAFTLDCCCVLHPTCCRCRHIHPQENRSGQHASALKRQQGWGSWIVYHDFASQDDRVCAGMQAFRIAEDVGLQGLEDTLGTTVRRSATVLPAGLERVRGTPL